MHNCASCSLAEIWFEEYESDVYLNMNRGATEEDIENDYDLEYEGQTIETVNIRVAFCPYCGLKLKSGDGIVVPQFQHRKFGGRK